MIYLRKHKPQRPYFVKFLLFVCGFIVLFGLVFVGRTYFFDSIVNALAPISGFFRSAAANTSHVFRSILPQDSVIVRNKELELKVQELETDLMDRQAILKENYILRQMLELGDPEFIQARVLLSPPQTPFGQIVINRGSLNGIRPGNQVFSSERTILGTIGEVYSDSATVVLYSAPGAKTGAYLERDGTIMELEGRGAGAFQVSVPLDLEILEGDSFFLPGDRHNLLATVVKIEAQESSSFKKVFLISPHRIRGDSILLIQI